MSISAGFTAEEIRGLVYEYQVQPHGQKAGWLTANGVPYRRMRRWQSAVFEGDLDRGLIPREGSAVTIPPEKRKELARERADQGAEVARLRARVRELEATNEALGKAIGLLHQLNEQEPGATPNSTVPPSSSTPTTRSSPS